MRYLSFLFLLFAFKLNAQSLTFSGTVKDSSGWIPLSNSTIRICKLPDTVTIKTLKTDAEGGFTFRNLPKAKLKITVTHIGYTEFVDTIDLQKNKLDHLIFLIVKRQTLQEVIVTRAPEPIRMKKDTLEFFTDSFPVLQNSSIEKMLKRLPGVEIGRDGGIYVNGQLVQKVFVDGKPFFGSNHKIATRFLKAEYVERIQVYRENEGNIRSDGSIGKSVIVVNIQLKKSKNTGYVGKLGIGKGLETIKTGQGAFLSFYSRKQIGGILQYQNYTDDDDDDDISKFSGEQVASDGRIQSEYLFRELYGPYTPWFNVAGIQRTSFSTYYGNSWKGDSTSVVASNNWKSDRKTGYETGNATFLLGDSTWKRFDTVSNSKLSDNNHFRFLYKKKFDSITVLKVATSLSYDKVKSRSFANQVNYGNDGTVISKGESINDYVSDFREVDIRTELTRSDSKKGKNTVWLLQFKTNDESRKGVLDYTNKYLRVLNSDDSSNQDNAYSNKSSLLGTYIESSKEISKQLSFTGSLNAAYYEVSNRVDVSATRNGSPQSRIDSLSAMIDYHVLVVQGFARLSFRKKKYSTSVGVQFGSNNQWQYDKMLDSNFRLSRLTFSPTLSYWRRTKKQGSFQINYSGNLRNPSIELIQRRVDNSNPLDLKYGNPKLRPSFNNIISLNYFEFSDEKNRSAFGRVYVYFPLNDFSEEKSYDSTGIVRTTPININGNLSGNFAIDHSRYYFKKRLRFGLSFLYDFRIRHTIVNKELNRASSNMVQLGFSNSTKISKKFSVSTRISRLINYGKSSLNTAILINNSNLSYGVSTSFEIGERFSLDADYFGATYDATAQFKRKIQYNSLDVSMDLGVFKSNRGTLKLVAKNILNQGSDIDRTYSTNKINETIQRQIGRVLLVQFIWDFDKVGGKNSGE